MKSVLIFILCMPLLNTTFISHNGTHIYAQNQGGNKIERVYTLELKSKVFDNTRKIRIFLPHEYLEKKNRNKSYPVLFLNDGVMVFHAYQLESTVDSLLKLDRIEPLIIVGIDNGASTQESTNPVIDRANEYLPWTDLLEDEANRLSDPQGRLYPNFLFDEVIPLVSRNFRIKKDRVGLGGASRGALIALYTAIKYPDKIERLLLESPSLYVNNQEILKQAGSISTWAEKTYIGIGTLEGDTEAIQQMALNDAIDLNKFLEQAGLNNKLEVDKGAAHDFNSFVRRFPIALQYLYGK